MKICLKKNALEWGQLYLKLSFGGGGGGGGGGITIFKIVIWRGEGGGVNCWLMVANCVYGSTGVSL